MRIVRAPRDYRSLGIVLDRGRKPGGWEHQLTISLWWFDIDLGWIVP